ncbi:unnamed protein product [Brassica oleracea]
MGVSVSNLRSKRSLNVAQMVRVDAKLAGLNTSCIQKPYLFTSVV